MAEKDEARERQRTLDQTRIDTFVVRARRICAHSLAQDLDRLRKLSEGEMQLVFPKAGGPATLVFDFPPEEVVESAAARVRPLMLDDVSMISVLKAIRSLTAESDDRESIRAWESEVRAEWNKRMGTSPSDDGFQTYYESATTGETGATNHIELAQAWIYGDVVHHDQDHLSRTQVWGVGERFRAAVPLVAFVMSAAWNVLENIREMENRKALTVSPRAWTVDVVAEERYERKLELAFVGGPGAALPTSASDVLGPEWQQFDPRTPGEPPGSAAPGEGQSGE